MPGFVYDNKRPNQLGYVDPSTGIGHLVDFWLFDESDVARAISAVRQRRFGSLPWTAFFVRTYTWYNSYPADTDTADTPIGLSLLVGTGYSNFVGSSNHLGRML